MAACPFQTQPNTVVPCHGRERCRMPSPISESSAVSTDPPRMLVEGRYGNVLSLASEKLDEERRMVCAQKAYARATASAS